MAKALERISGRAEGELRLEGFCGAGLASFGFIDAFAFALQRPVGSQSVPPHFPTCSKSRARQNISLGLADLVSKAGKEWHVPSAN